MSRPHHHLTSADTLWASRQGYLLVAQCESGARVRKPRIVALPGPFTNATTLNMEAIMPKDPGPAEFIAAMLSAGATLHLSNPTDEPTAEERIADALEKLADKDD